MKKHWYVWLSMFLSLGLAISSCGIASMQTQEVSSVSTEQQVPKFSVIGAALHQGQTDYEVQQYLEVQHFLSEHKKEQDRIAAEKAAEAQRAAERRAAELAAAKRARSAPRATGPSTGRCGGDLPPCWVMERESGGDINAYNPTGCYEGPGRVGCRGKWQCSTSTCSGTGTEEEQDAEARALWDDGKGCKHWNAC